VRFEPTISAGERPQTYALVRVATGTGIRSISDRTQIRNFTFGISYVKVVSKLKLMRAA